MIRCISDSGLEGENMVKNQFICRCFKCNRIVMRDVVDSDLLTISPVYDGLIFRSTGNYGSTVFDPMPIGKEEMLEIIICDNCVKSGKSCVARIFDIQRVVNSKSASFNPSSDE